LSKFESFLSAQFEEFIDYRLNLGYTTKPLISHLKTLDRYVKEKQVKKEMISPLFFLELRSNLQLEKRTVNRIISVARVFFQFLVRKGYYKENPVQDIPLLPENGIVPFIFSPEEIDHLLTAICKRLRKHPKYFIQDLSIYLAILMLVRCGLRISEPLKLLKEHYQHEEKTLYIEKTKFKKDRLIPVPECVATEIENYLAVRNMLLRDEQSPYLLINKFQKPLNQSIIMKVFKRAVKDIGIDQPRRIIANTNFSAPNPHSCRHSFAVNTLKRIKKQGKSPQNALPVLAAYMGHSEYKHTTKYLKVLDAEHRQQMVDFSISLKEEV